MRFVEKLLSGLKDPSILDDVDWDYNLLFRRFKGHILEQEAALRSALRLALYYVSDNSTLELLTGGRQPEKVCLSNIFSTGTYLFVSSCFRSSASYCNE